MSEQTKGILLTALGILFVVPDSLLVRLIQAEPLVTSFWRSGLSGAVMLLALLFMHGRQLPTEVKKTGRAGLIFILFMAGGTLCFVLAVRNTSVANTLFIASTSPVFSAIVSWAFLGERISRRMIWTIFLALIGIAIIASGSLDEGSQTILGDLAALGLAIMLAVALTAARSIRPVSMVPAAALSQIFLAFVLFWFINPWAMSNSDWMYAIILAIVFLPVGQTLLALGPRYITSAEVSLLILLEAVLAPILVWAVLGELPATLTLIGGAFVLVVLLISNLIGIKRSTKTT